ncbi:hypothetical protein PENTCL1PPCAC_1478, partial [Pristionchus entomophagus]
APLGDPSISSSSDLPSQLGPSPPTCSPSSSCCACCSRCYPRPQATARSIDPTTPRTCCECCSESCDDAPSPIASSSTTSFPLRPSATLESVAL